MSLAQHHQLLQMLKTKKQNKKEKKKLWNESGESDLEVTSLMAAVRGKGKREM